MKKMYKKPVTEKVALEPQVRMQTELGVSLGGHDNLNAAPRQGATGHTM